MRKVIHFLLWLNISFFFVYTFIEYSYSNNRIIEEDMCSIQIVKPENVNNDMFIESLTDICQKNRVDVFLKTVNDSFSIRPTINIYKTNVTMDFLRIPIKNKDNLILCQGEYCSTKIYKDKNYYKIVGSSLVNHINIYDIHELRNHNLDCCVYYTNKKMVSTLTQALIENGYEVSVININSKENFSPWLYSQILIALLFFISTMIYLFYLNKEIIIKKVNGYGDIRLLFDELIPIIISAVFGIICSMTIVIITMAFFYIDSICNYIKYMIPNISIFLLVIILSFCISGFYIFTQKNATNIKGRTKNKEIKIVSFIIKCIMLVITLYELTNCIHYMISFNNIKGNYATVKNMISDMYYIPLNASSVDINDNIEYYNERSISFFEELYRYYDDDDILVVDIDEYVSEDQKGVEFFFATINPTYLTLNSIYDNAGNLITQDSYSREESIIFLPQKYYNNKDIQGFVNNILLLDADTEIHYYKSNTAIQTFNADIGDSKGCVYDAVLYMPKKAILKQNAMSLLSGCHLMINDSNNSVYETILPIIKKYNLENIIVQAQSAKDYYQTRIFSIRLLATKSMFTSIVIAFVYIISVLFQLSVYFSNDRKRIAVSIVNGYGDDVHLSYYCELLVVMTFGFVISFLFSLYPYILFLSLVIELIIFLVFKKKWNKKNVAVILKGGI